LASDCSAAHGKRLVSRIAGIVKMLSASTFHGLTSTKVFLFPHQSYDNSAKELSFGEPDGYHSSKLEKLARLSDRPWYNSHELEDLPGVINTMTIRVGDSSSFLMRQASRGVKFVCSCSKLTVNKVPRQRLSVF
jgi:hypothetical protein